MKTALVTGISGQGGAYLAQHLLELGYRVIGTTRDQTTFNQRNLKLLGIADKVSVRGLELSDRQSVLALIDRERPSEIYHLAAPSSVGLSYKEPAETIQNITLTNVNLLDAVRQVDSSIPCLLASSTEMFGHCEAPASVNSKLNPASPYGVGKSCAYLQTRNYREAYGLFVCSGVFSNFESPLRTQNYVTSKIVSSACKVFLGDTDVISLGNLSVRRDWGSAPEFMRAAHLALQQKEPRDYLIATGQTNSLLDFLESVCRALGLDYKNHLKVNQALIRPLDIPQTLCDPSATWAQLDWKASTFLDELAIIMLRAELTRLVGEVKAGEILSD